MGMSLPTVLPEADRAALIACVNRPTSTQRDVLRARIILTWPDHGMRATARLLGCAKSTVVRWRDRYRARGLPGLRDLPRSGAPRTHGDKQRRAVAAVATTDPPRPWGSWTHARLAAHVNSLSPAFLDAPARAAAATPVSAAPVSRSWVGRVLRDAHIRVHRVRGWLHRKPDPQFEERIAAIEAAVAVARRGQRTVLCLDEKTALPVRTPCHPDTYGPAGRRRRECRIPPGRHARLVRHPGRGRRDDRAAPGPDPDGLGRLHHGPRRPGRRGTGAGRGHRPVGRSGVAGRLHPGGVPPLPPDGAAVEPGRFRRLRLPRLPLPLLLGTAPAPGVHPGRAASSPGRWRIPNWTSAR